MTNAPFATIEEYRDVESLNAYAEDESSGTAMADAIAGLRAMSRDHARTPVQWNDSPNAGFTTGTPWIGVNPNHDRINAAAQYDHPDSVFEYYRRLIALRHELAVIAHGTFERADAGHPAIFAFERVLGAERLLVVVNLSGTEHAVEFAPAFIDRWRDAELLLTNSLTDAPAAAPGALLAPWEAAVYAIAP